MASPGYNEADTRAKLIDPALQKASWPEPVPEAEREANGAIQREESAVRIDILDGKPLKRGRGRVDYLLRARGGGHDQPLALAFVEPRKERALPTSGLEQVKEHARPYAVKFLCSTNVHQFIEHHAHARRTTDPLPMASFPSPPELRQRWFAANGVDPAAPALGPLLTAYSAAGDRPRYCQDAAIRAAIDRTAIAASPAWH